MGAHAGNEGFWGSGSFEGSPRDPLDHTSAASSPKASQNAPRELILPMHLNSPRVACCLQFRLYFNCCSGSLTVNSYLHARERKRLCHSYRLQLVIDGAAVISTAIIFLLDSSSTWLLGGYN